MRLTAEELAAMPAKTKKDPTTLALYQEHDFLDAYALHTARRIDLTGYKAAVGADEHNWDSHGELQRDFLISQGLRPTHSLLDIGCGTGRLARKVVPYLDPGGYVGVDISIHAIAEAQRLKNEEGWDDREPEFWVGDIREKRRFDFIWSFSVFIHLPQDIMESVMRRAAAAMHSDSRFFWAYVPEPKAYRSGVKQFRHTLEDYRGAAVQVGLTFDEVPDWIVKAGYEPGRWSGHQRMARSRLT